MLRAGDLRHRITIQARTNVSDGMGGYSMTWTDFATVYAAIWPMKGKEAVENMREGATVTHRVRIRYISGVKANMQILFGSRVFKLVAPPINRDELSIELELICEEET